MLKIINATGIYAISLGAGLRPPDKTMEFTRRLRFGFYANTHRNWHLQIRLVFRQISGDSQFRQAICIQL